MIFIETKRLILRNYQTGDFADIRAYFSNEEVSRYEDFYPMTDAQIAEIKAAKEKLMGSAQKVFTKMYEQAGAAAQGADPNMGAGPNPGAGPAPEGFQGDDVVDGDYKEV